MRKNLFMGFFFITFIALTASFGFGLDLQYKDYEVKKGDTLWDISQAELNDYFLWPNIWKENPEIKNPDLIYPAQHIRIPIYLLQRQVKLEAPEPAPAPKEPAEEIPAAKETPPVEEKEAVPEVAEEMPAEKRYLFDKQLVILCGYISPDIPSVGSIKGAPTQRAIVGEGDEIYIQVKGDTTPGRKFYIFRNPAKKVKHPKGGFVGYLVEITGIAEIVGEESGYTKAVITSSFLDTIAEPGYGDYLQDYFEIEPPVITAEPRTPDIKGMIVETRDRRVLNAEGDIIYIDKGSIDGVQQGDVFTIMSGKFPFVKRGKMIVLLTKEKTATAYVTGSTNVIQRGDTF